MKRKVIFLTMVGLLSGSLFLTACGTKEETIKTEDKQTVEETKEEVKEETKAALTDGFYFAQGEAFDDQGYKDVVSFKVTDGKINSVYWNTVSIDGASDKLTLSEDGNYPMVEQGGAKAPFHEQVATAVKFIEEGQKLDEVDAIAGVSIHVEGFLAGLQKAKENGPDNQGAFKDGTYYAEEKEFDEHNGFKATVSIKVLGGHIVAVNWNGIDKDGLDKKTASIEGKYPMVEQGGAKAPWHEQAAETEQYLIDSQYADGTVDTVASVTMKVNPFFALVEEALKEAK